MKKYALCVKAPMTYNAGSKAVIDATDIAISAGYKKMYYAYLVPLFAKYKFLQPLNKLINFLLCYYLSFRILSTNTYFVQWPSPGKSTKILFRSLIRKQPRIIMLIHDLNDLRGIIYPEDEVIMYAMFAAASTIIVHTESMRDYLVSKGVDPNIIQILYTFDYLTSDIPPERTFNKIVSYAGNLSKSVFLQDISVTDKDVLFYCYGANYSNNNSAIVYKGRFSPNNVSKIEGAWGLVWDGNSTKTCTGEFGNYLKYNSPHKVSLYIVAELPIIIWDQQALAKYIVDRNLGIVVSSIDDIPSKLSNISEEDYWQIRKNLKEEANLLKNGDHLRKFL